MSELESIDLHNRLFVGEHNTRTENDLLQSVVHVDNQRIYRDLLHKEHHPIVTNTTEFMVEKDKVPMIQFTPFEQFDFIQHGFSTRLGGVSSGIYSSMNLTFHLEDDPANVSENFRRIGDALQIDPAHMVYTKQTHTTNVMRVNREFYGMGVTKERTYDNIDGLITDEPGLCLITSYADCVPLFFVDPVHRCIGTSHSGWRGTVGNIAENTVKLMKQEFGTKPEDLVTFIGPSICVDCYEVSEDVAVAFQNAYRQDEVEAIVQPGKKPGKYQLNLQMANYYNMVHAGILPEHIGVSDLCTCCNHDLLFSHRASHGKRGILCGFLAIKPE